MDKTFTELLDDYLDARDVYERLREAGMLTPEYREKYDQARRDLNRFVEDLRGWGDRPIG